MEIIAVRLHLMFLLKTDFFVSLVDASLLFCRFSSATWVFPTAEYETLEFSIMNSLFPYNVKPHVSQFCSIWSLDILWQWWGCNNQLIFCRCLIVSNPLVWSVHKSSTFAIDVTLILLWRIINNLSKQSRCFTIFIPYWNVLWFLMFEFMLRNILYTSDQQNGRNELYCGPLCFSPKPPSHKVSILDNEVCVRAIVENHSCGADVSKFFHMA